MNWELYDFENSGKLSKSMGKNLAEDVMRSLGVGTLYSHTRFEQLFQEYDLSYSGNISKSQMVSLIKQMVNPNNFKEKRGSDQQYATLQLEEQNSNYFNSEINKKIQKKNFKSPINDQTSVQTGLKENMKTNIDISDATRYNGNDVSVTGASANIGLLGGNRGAKNGNPSDSAAATGAP